MYRISAKPIANSNVGKSQAVRKTQYVLEIILNLNMSSFSKPFLIACIKKITSESSRWPELCRPYPKLGFF